ncbi:alpha/beta-hydrolase [Xylariaceae sp. FL0804]|nr:alpha/beta-hydrolase [Xylariaceae sp. FL0804]
MASRWILAVFAVLFSPIAGAPPGPPPPGPPPSGPFPPGPPPPGPHPPGLPEVGFFPHGLPFHHHRSPPFTSPRGPGSSAPPRAASDAPEVDLGYGIFKGFANDTTGLNVWLGIRYATAPIGNLRWQEPQQPATNRTVTDATTFGPQCPQSYPGGSNSTLFFTLGDEDCLFLNVYAPQNVSSAGLPVLVWIHGGGYGFGNGTQDMTEIINANDNGFLAVSIQYRLGAFGFLASEEVRSDGVVNAGLLDQMFALQWVQTYISAFGGDPTRVTISGESSGGGSVMLLATTEQAATRNLYQNAIAASPYLPTQWSYDEPAPTSRYYQFAQIAGCPSSGYVFDCLVGADTGTLQFASNYVSQDLSAYGEWAFLPVTDGVYLSTLPSVNLEEKKVHGSNILVGNNANEGGLFAHNPAAPIVTTEQVREWLPQHFPRLNDSTIDQILALYPAADNQTTPKQETTGIHAPCANNVSQDAVGNQQRVNNIYAEATFVCPSYWLAAAFTDDDKKAYHYQYSVPFAEHQADITAYFGPRTPNQSPAFVHAFRRIWGNLITTGDPSITDAEAYGYGYVKTEEKAPNAASDFPVWDEAEPWAINLNETGGVPYQTYSQWGTPVTQYAEPGLRNAISSFNAYTWEAGRGARCDFWKSISPQIMK